MKRFVCLAVAAALLLGLLCGCTLQKKKYTAYSMDYFDTMISVTGYETDRATFDSNADEIIALLGEYHRLYTIYHRFEGTENLCTINELVDGVHRTVAVDRRIIDLLLYAKEMYEATDGMMNIAMGSVLSLWHNYRAIGMDTPEKAELPPMDQLQEAAKHTDIEKMVIDEKNNTVTLTDPKMKLDVGAIAKGYATEQVARAMEQKGLSSYILNVGGNVRAIGARADGSDWSVGIENPDGGDYFAYLNLNGMSVVTSGSYQRFYYVGGKPYHHIIHPDTLMPAEGYLSVSVLCKDSGMADALSTALFCLPQTDGQALIDKIDGVEALWVTTDGEKTASSGWSQHQQTV
mgnify:CR=1 FL=1